MKTLQDGLYWNLNKKNCSSKIRLTAKLSTTGAQNEKGPPFHIPFKLS